MNWLTPALVIVIGLNLSVFASDENEIDIADVRGNMVSVTISDQSSLQEKRLIADMFWRQVIEFILADEIKKREIEVSQESIDRYAEELADVRLSQLGSSYEDRQKHYSTVHNMTRHISKALAIWQNSPADGDAYAKKHLEPIGVSSDYWEWIKNNHGNESVAKSIIAGHDYSDRNVILESEKQAKHNLQQEALANAIAAEHDIDNNIIQQYAFMISNADAVQLIVRRATVYDRKTLLLDNIEFNEFEGDYVQMGVIGPWEHEDNLSDESLQAMAEAAFSIASGNNDTGPHPIFLLEGGMLYVKFYQINDESNKVLNAFELSEENRLILEHVHTRTRFGDWLFNVIEEVQVPVKHEWLLGNWDALKHSIQSE